jgi:hypothetical protein
MPGVGTTSNWYSLPAPLMLTDCNPASGNEMRWGPRRSPVGDVVRRSPCQASPASLCCSIGAGPVPSTSRSMEVADRRTLSISAPEEAGGEATGIGLAAGASAPALPEGAVIGVADAQTGLAEATAVSRGRTSRQGDITTQFNKPFRRIVSAGLSINQWPQPCSRFGRSGCRRLAGRHCCRGSIRG